MSACDDIRNRSNLIRVVCANNSDDANRIARRAEHHRALALRGFLQPELDVHHPERKIVRHPAEGDQIIGMFESKPAVELDQTHNLVRNARRNAVLDDIFGENILKFGLEHRFTLAERRRAGKHKNSEQNSFYAHGSLLRQRSLTTPTPDIRRDRHGAPAGQAAPAPEARRQGR